MSVLDSFSLKGKIAIATGGAGMYGRQIVAALAEAGATTIIASRQLDKLETIAAEYRGRGFEVWALPLDLGDEASVLALRDAVVARWQRIDVLVNNAVARPSRQGWNGPLSEFVESMKINATGLFAITRAIGDVMAGQGRGSIVNIGSIQGMIGPDAEIYKGCGFHGFYPDYFFHKGGMINFTRFVASYYGPRGVRCNCLSPGGLYNKHEETFERQYSARTFLGRMANQTDLQGAVVFLAADASAYITGTNLPVDGGYTAK